jgi:hypothetical protein
MLRPRFALIAVALLIGCGLSASRARAGYIVTLAQQGNGVVATGTGPIDLTGLTFFATVSTPVEMQPNGAIIITGAPLTNGFEDLYGGFITGPTNFGSGTNTTADSGMGDLVGISTSAFVFVPAGYVSGSPLSDSATYNNATFASLGVTPGTYEWTWGTGPNQNFTLIAVPEPSVSVLLVIGILLAGISLRQLCSRSGAA